MSILLSMIWQAGNAQGISFEVRDTKWSVKELMQQLEASTSDSARTRVLAQIGYYYLSKRKENSRALDSAAHYLTKAKRLSNSLGGLGSLTIDNYLHLYYNFTAQRQKEIDLLQQMAMASAKAGKTNEQAKFLYYAAVITGPHAPLDSVDKYGLPAITAFRLTNDKMQTAEVLKFMANVHLNNGSFSLAEKELLEAAALYKARNNPILSQVYDLLAALHGKKGDLNKQLDYSLLTLSNIEHNRDTGILGTNYLRIADAYAKLGYVEESITYYEKAYQLYLAGKVQAVYSVLSELSQLLIKAGRVQQVKERLQALLRQFPPAIDMERYFVCEIYGDYYNGLRQYELAEKSYTQMFAYARGIDDKSLLAETWQVLGRFYGSQGRFSESHAYMEKARSQPLNDVFKSMEQQWILYKADSALRNYAEAINHFAHYKALNDSIFTLTKNRQIEELRIKYETGKKEQEMQSLREQSRLLTVHARLQEKALKQAAMIRNITYALIILLVIILLLLFNRYQNKRKTTRLLQSKQEEIHDKNEFLQTLVTEKEWLLKEVHHRVKNNLQITIDLLNAAQDTYHDNEVAVRAIRESENRMQAISLIHQKLYQSDNITHIPMPEYISELAGQLQDNFVNAHRLHFTLAIEPIELDVAQAVPVGLILNEAITNSIKYGFPEGTQGHITITLQQPEPGIALLVIADNGQGLPPAFDIHQQQGHSFGFSLIQGLTRQLGGAFHYLDHKGLELRIRFPMLQKPVQNRAAV